MIRMVDQNLPGLTRDIALACWNAVDAHLPERPGNHLYRSLYRAVRGVFRTRVQAFRYCGARTCDDEMKSTLGTSEWHERYAPGPERIHRFAGPLEAPPSALLTELLRAALGAVVRAVPRRSWKGLARLLRRQIEKALYGRLYLAPRCGERLLCEANEPYDPWDMRDPINAIGETAGV